MKPLTSVVAVVLLLTAGRALAASPATVVEPAVHADSPKPERTFALTFMAPTTAWKLKIARVYAVGKTPWVIARLTPPAGMAGDALTPVSAHATLAAPAGEPKYVVLGKTWNWENDEPYEFVDAAKSDAFLKTLEKRKDAKLLWSEPVKAEPVKAEPKPAP